MPFIHDTSKVCILHCAGNQLACAEMPLCHMILHTITLHRGIATAAIFMTQDLSNDQSLLQGRTPENMKLDHPLFALLHLHAPVCNCLGQKHHDQLPSCGHLPVPRVGAIWTNTQGSTIAVPTIAESLELRLSTPAILERKAPRMFKICHQKE
jgi:hypothetical protein